jgi:hypothetical protein
MSHERGAMENRDVVIFTLLIQNEERLVTGWHRRWRSKIFASTTLRKIQ